MGKDDDAGLIIPEKKSILDYEIVQFSTIFNESYSTKRLDDTTQTPEYNSGDDLVILDGYVEYTKSIQDMIMAGENLANNRLYDNEEALSNEDYAQRIAQLRHPNTDIVDVQNYTDYLNEKMEKARSIAERKAIEADIDPGNVFSGREKVPPTEETPAQEILNQAKSK